jgi:hypothetical protein
LFILFVATILRMHTIEAQRKTQDNTVFAELTKEETEFTFCSLGLHIFSLDVNTYNLPVTFGLEGLLTTQKTYAGMGFKVGQGLIDSPNQYQFEGSLYGRLQLVRSAIVYGGFHILDWTKRETVKITLSRGYNTTTYTKVRANVKTTFGVDAAYEWGITPYTGTANHFIGIGNGFSRPIQIPGRGQSRYTTYDFGIVHIGFGFTKQHFTEINTDKYGIKSAHRFLRYYVHISLPSKSILEQIVIPNVNTFDLNGHTTISRFGYNIGVMSTGIKKIDGIGFIEIGYFPGPKMNYINNLYLKFGGGFSITKLFGIE